MTSFIDAGLKAEKDLQKLKMLALSSILMFNKRRPFEVHDLEVSTFVEAKRQQQQSENCELLAQMTATERALAER